MWGTSWYLKRLLLEKFDEWLTHSFDSLLVSHFSHSSPSPLTYCLIYFSHRCLSPFLSPLSLSLTPSLLLSPLSATHCVHFASLHPRFLPSSSVNANSMCTTKVSVCKWAPLITGGLFFIENHLIKFDSCHKRRLCRSIKVSRVGWIEGVLKREFCTEQQMLMKSLSKD